MADRLTHRIARLAVAVALLTAFAAAAYAAVGTPVVTTPPTARSFVSGPPTLAWEAAGEAIGYKLYRTPGEAPCEPETQVGLLDAATLSFSDATAGDGPWCYVLEAVGAGDTASRAEALTIIRDTSVPTGQLDPAAGGFVTATRLVRITAESDLAPVVGAQLLVRTDPSGDYVAAGTDGDPSDGLAVAVDPSLDGRTVDLRADITDAAGNVGQADAAGVRVDLTAPSGIVEAPSPTRGIVALQVAAPSTDIVSATFAARPAPSGAFADIATDTTADGWSASWDSTGVADGDYDVVATLTDAAGNRQTTAPRRVAIDNTAPTVVLADPGDGARVSGAAVPLSATATDAAGVTRLDLQVRPASAPAWTTVRSVTVPAAGASWDTRGLVGGPWEVRAVAFDAVGNQGADTHGVTIDTGVAEPGTPVATSPTSQAPQLVWPAPPPSEDVRGHHVYRNGERITAAPVSGTSYVDSPPGDGTYVYAIVAVDGSGNLSAPSSTVTVVYDATAPTPPAGLSVSSAGGGQVAVAWAPSTDAGSGVAGYVVRRSAAGAPPPASRGEGAAVCDVPSAVGCVDASGTPGASYAVFAIDRAGNVSGPATATFVLAAAPPPGGSAVVPPTGGPAPTGPAPDRVAPGRPTRLVRSLAGLRATVRWRNPAAADFRRVRVVVNRAHRPRTPADGLLAYAGRATRATLHLRPGSALYVAIFAEDRAGNISRPAFLTLHGPVGPLSPSFGQTVSGVPVLRWKAVAGATYYHVQVFRSGRRVAIAWPVARSLRMPRTALRHGASYVWYVWPGLGAKARAAYGPLIGTGRFRYR